MVAKSGKPSVSGRNGSMVITGNDLAARSGLRTREVLQNGVTSVASAAHLAIAAAEDMLSGKLTPQEATVINTTSGRVLKAAELCLRHGSELLLPMMRKNRARKITTA